MAVTGQFKVTLELPDGSVQKQGFETYNKRLRMDEIQRRILLPMPKGTKILGLEKHLTPKEKRDVKAGVEARQAKPEPTATGIDVLANPDAHDKPVDFALSQEKAEKKSEGTKTVENKPK